MPLVKGIDQPVRDYLANLPTPAEAGICVCSDPRGIPSAVSGKRYAYLLQREYDAGKQAALQFWRYDLESRSKFRLAAPPAPFAGVYNYGVAAACYVPFGGVLEDQPFVYVIISISAAPWCQLMAYNVLQNTWAVLLAIPGLAAALGTSIAITNTSGAMGDFFALGANIRNRFLYISGNGGTLGGGAVVSNVDQYNMVTNAHVLLTGAGLVRTGAPGAGSKLAWLPNYPDRLYSNRGGGSVILDYYSFSTNAWTPNTPPQLVATGEGTEIVTLYEAPGWMAVRPGDPGNEILAIEGGGLNYQLVANIGDAILPAAHASNALIAWWIAGQYYMGAIPYGTTQFKRIQIPMPL